METTRAQGTVRPGHGVASGKGKDPRYPMGTLRQQAPHFLARGLDLGAYYPGTVNVDIAPHRYEIREPKHFIEDVDWSPHIPPENFYFFDVVLHAGGRAYRGLVYLPDPATKADHLQGASVLELILPEVAGLGYGDAVEVELWDRQMGVV